MRSEVRSEARKRAVFRIALVYLALMTVVIWGAILLVAVQNAGTAAQPHDLDCHIVASDELWCRAMP